MSAGAKLGGGGLPPPAKRNDVPPVRLAPIRINLLPHREMKREQRKKDFLRLAGLVAISGAAVVLLVGLVINQRIATQQARNDFISAENQKLDAEIAEIKTLREDIAALKARQEAVENLQRDRTAPVRLLDELVRLIPDGVYLRQLKQEGARVALFGHAQSNERVAELLRNLAERSPLLERPELGEIKEIALPPLAGSKEPRRLYEYTLTVLMKQTAPTGAAQVAAR
jgi:type IV pilus assembly protein PilN